MSSTVCPNCKRSEPTSSKCCAINWSSTSNTFANAETICPKSEIGPGRTDERACSQLRFQQPEELPLPAWGFTPEGSADLHLGREDRVGEWQGAIFDQKLLRPFRKGAHPVSLSRASHRASAQ